MGISIDDIETALEKATLSANISIEKAVESSNLKDLFINVIAKLDEKFLKMFGKKIIEDCEPVENAEKVVYQISIEWAKILVKQF